MKNQRCVTVGRLEYSWMCEGTVDLDEVPSRIAQARLGADDPRTAIEALNSKQSMQESDTIIRWVHSELILADGARAPHSMNNSLLKEASSTWQTGHLG